MASTSTTRSTSPQSIVQVTVQFIGQLANELGMSSKAIEVEKGTKLQSIVEDIDKHTGGRYHFLVAVDNKQVTDYNIDVNEDSEIMLLSPMSGG